MDRFREEGETERQCDSATVRQPERETQTGRQTDRQTDRGREREWKGGMSLGKIDR